LNDGDDGTRTRGLRRESGPAIGLYNKIAGSAKGRLSWQKSHKTQYSVSWVVGWKFCDRSGEG